MWFLNNREVLSIYPSIHLSIHNRLKNLSGSMRRSQRMTSQIILTGQIMKVIRSINFLVPGVRFCSYVKSFF